MNETRNIIASLEFGEKESQICYYDRKEKNPVSLAVKTGTTEYTFPTRLSKRPKTNIWHFGAESEYFSKYEGEILVEDVLNLCRCNVTKYSVASCRTKRRKIIYAGWNH